MNLHPSASNTSRWWFLFAFFFLFQGLGFAQSSSTPGHAKVVSKPTYRHHKKQLKRRRKTSRVAKKLSRTENQTAHKLPAPMKLHVPHPGAGGEERSDNWFYLRRAWPNQTIDPSFYPNALAQAAKMPVFSNSFRKDGTLSVMQWQSIGPNSIDGRVTCIATHPTDSNTFYVGAASGGLWKTTDHGGSWTCVTDTFGSLSIGCVTLDPTAPETIYLGLGECNESGDSYPGDGLWKSTDGGNSWNSLGFGKAQYIAKEEVLVDPRDHEKLFVAVPGPNSSSDTNRGIFQSTDGGAGSWTRSLSGGVTITSAPGCADPIPSAPVLSMIAMNPR